MNLGRRLAAEGIGTAALLAVIVGSGIMAERLAAGNTAIALLANAIATGCALFALIVVLAPFSGAHFNPLVTLNAALTHRLAWREAGAYMLVQVAAAFIGAAVAHLMFELPLFSVSQHTRSGFAQFFSEAVATFGLLLIILGAVRHSIPVVAAAVGAYITAAYWFTASTSFANPAVTLARAVTDTFSGIHPPDVLGFILFQVIGASAAVLLMRWLSPADLDA